MVTVLVVFCGIPGSGKTTVAKHLQTTLDIEPLPTIYNVAFDDGIAQKEVWTEQTFAESRQTGMDAVKQHLENSISSSCNTVILVDDIMYLHSMRRQMYVLARDYGAHHMLIVHVSADIDVALARNAIRDMSTQVEETSIRRMFDRFEQPNHKLVHEKHVVYIDANNDDSMTTGINELMTQIGILLRTNDSTISRRLIGLDIGDTTNDVSMHLDRVGGYSRTTESEQPVEADIKNSMHCLDLDLRKVIGMIMQSKEINSLGSTVRIPLSKALGEAKNSTLLHARGMECISIESELVYFQNVLSVVVDKQDSIVNKVVVHEIVAQALLQTN